MRGGALYISSYTDTYTYIYRYMIFLVLLIVRGSLRLAPVTQAKSSF